MHKQTAHIHSTNHGQGRSGENRNGN